jgi:hypothetical protein
MEPLTLTFVVELACPRCNCEPFPTDWHLMVEEERRRRG